MNIKLNDPQSVQINNNGEFLCLCKSCKTPFVEKYSKIVNTKLVCLQCGADDVKIVCELSKEKEKA